MSQPNWTFLANLGDVNPLEHGGYFVYTDDTGVYAPEAEYIQTDDDGEIHVHRVVLDRCKMVDGYLISFAYDVTWPHPVKSYDEWFADDLDKVAETMGQDTAELRAMFCSADALERAQAYRMVYDYHGWENGDSYPRTLSYEEALIRYQGDAMKPDGYHDCECCGETIMCALLCDGCVKAGCKATPDSGNGWYFQGCEVETCEHCDTRGVAHERWPLALQL